MIMCHKNYKEYGKDDVASWGKWVKMVNDNEKYCTNWNIVKEIKFYVYLKLGKINLYELPSCHIHWDREAKKDRIKYVRNMEEKLKRCIEDPKLYKTEFNASASYHGILGEINDYKKKYNIK